MKVEGVQVDLLAIARAVCELYHDEFPDEFDRYGPAAEAWCVHDLQHLLNWAAGEVNGYYEMNPQVRWLAGVLEARDFPLDRLARGLEISAEVVPGRISGSTGARLSRVLVGAAAYVRDAHPTH